MRSVLSLIGAASLALSGCVVFPELPGGARVDIVDIVDNIECEIQAAIFRDLPRHYWLLGWAATFTLHLQTKTEPEGSGEVTISIPLMPETFGLSLSVGPETYYHSKGGFTYKTPLTDIATKTCPPLRRDDEPTKSVLTGRTGAGDWLVRVANDSTFSGICPQSMDFYLDFRIIVSGDGNPKITGIEVGDGKLGVDTKLQGKKTKEHKISLTAVPISDSNNKDEQKKVDAIFATAEDIVRDRLGAQIDKTQIRACAPLDPAFLVVRRGPINTETLDDLDAADLRAILRALPSRQSE
jgi:hypothetical protein